MTRILVCGGRIFDNREFVFHHLDKLHKVYEFDTLMEGGAPGVDKFAGEWAEQTGIKHLCFSANWGKHGVGAGATRNSSMMAAGNPDMIIAFKGGKGTANMVMQASKMGVGIIRITR